MIKEKVCHYLPGEMGGEGIMKKVTNGGKGGPKIWHFRGDAIFEWSLWEMGGNLPRCNVIKLLQWDLYKADTIGA